MQIFMLLFLFPFSLLALQVPSTMQADFTQKVTNEHNQTLTYSGSLYFKAPHQSKWRYESPSPKTICVNSRRIVIIEDDLQQASIYSNNSHIKLQSLLQEARQTGQGRYKTRFEGVTYHITLQEGKLYSIAFTDKMHNRSRITFSGVVYDKPLTRTLSCDIPPSYDLIRE